MPQRRRSREAITASDVAQESVGRGRKRKPAKELPRERGKRQVLADVSNNATAPGRAQLRRSARCAAMSNPSVSVALPAEAVVERMESTVDAAQPKEQRHGQARRARSRSRSKTRLTTASTSSAAAASTGSEADVASAKPSLDAKANKKKGRARKHGTRATKVSTTDQERVQREVRESRKQIKAEPAPAAPEPPLPLLHPPGTVLPPPATATTTQVEELAEAAAVVDTAAPSVPRERARTHGTANSPSYVDVDDSVSTMPKYVADYAKDIFSYRLQRESRFRPRQNYLVQFQQDINPEMREILVDWLVEVAEEYSLQQATLFTAVNYVDRSLEKFQVVSQGVLPLPSPTFHLFFYIVESPG